jgi:putative ABC transport system ATP-binding protein
MSDTRKDAVVVELSDVKKEYPLGNVVVKAVRGVDMTIKEGDFVAIAGPSGSGKSTLLNLIGCVDVATSGTVLVAGQDTGKLKESQLAKLRLFEIGFIFQSFNLIAVLSAFQNVEFPLRLQRKLSKPERRQRVEQMLKKVGLGEHMHHRPGELSGGQRQRVAIARALVTGPKLVLADEPTANLDTVTGDAIIALMKELNRDDGTTFLFSTHDDKVMQQADRVFQLVDGKVAA